MNEIGDKLIVSAKPTSFPPELHDIVINSLNHIPANELRQLKQFAKLHECVTGDVFDNYFGILSSHYNLYQQKLIPLFDQYDILCYHATRVRSKESILLCGLRAEMQDYIEELKRFLLIEGISADRISYAISLIQKEFQRKYSDNPHQICFFTNLISFRNANGSAGYDQFCETVGGELADWALEKQCPDVHEILQTKGISVVVEFTIPFSCISDSHKCNVILPFIAHVVTKELSGINYEVEADGSLICKIPPSRILRLIDPDSI